MAESNEVLLELRGIQKYFGELHVLQDVNLTIAPGTVTCIVGPSGSGKSTLLRSINMLEEIDNGAIFFREEMIGQVVKGDHRIPVSSATRRKQTLHFGMVFQHFNLFPNRTALENVMLAPAKVRRVKRNTARQEAMTLLDRVGLATKADNYPSELSGGERQRVAIARALAMEPEILLFDEPTSALDPELVGEVLEVIRELALRGATMLIVTHEIAFARDVADEIVMMADGKVIESGPPDVMLSNPTTDRAKRFFASIAKGV